MWAFTGGSLIGTSSYYDGIGWLPKGPDWMASPRRFVKGPLMSAGVHKGWLPKRGGLRVLSDGISVYF